MSAPSTAAIDRISGPVSGNRNIAQLRPRHRLNTDVANGELDWRLNDSAALLVHAEERVAETDERAPTSRRGRRRAESAQRTGRRQHNNRMAAHEPLHAAYREKSASFSVGSAVACVGSSVNGN